MSRVLPEQPSSRTGRGWDRRRRRRPLRPAARSRCWSGKAIMPPSLIALGPMTLALDEAMPVSGSVWTNRETVGFRRCTRGSVRARPVPRRPRLHAANRASQQEPLSVGAVSVEGRRRDRRLRRGRRRARGLWPGAGTTDDIAGPGQAQALREGPVTVRARGRAGRVEPGGPAVVRGSRVAVPAARSRMRARRVSRGSRCRGSWGRPPAWSVWRCVITTHRTSARMPSRSSCEPISCSGSTHSRTASRKTGCQRGK